MLRWDKAAKRQFGRCLALQVVGHRRHAGTTTVVRVTGINQGYGTFVTEGEKAADAIRELGLVATTSAGGSSAAAKTDWSPLAGKTVVVCPDNDEPGEKYGNQVASILVELNPPAPVKLLRFPASTQKAMLRIG